MPSQALQKGVKNHLRMTKWIQETMVCGNINVQSALSLLWLSYSTHRYLMSKDEVYRTAIHYAMSEEWRDRINKRVARRLKNSIKKMGTKPILIEYDVPPCESNYMTLKEIMRTVILFGIWSIIIITIVSLLSIVL